MTAFGVRLQDFAAVLLFLSVPLATPAQMRGDSAAVAAVERMLEATGGKAMWATGRTLELEYRAWVLTPRARQVTEVAWRDLSEPAQRIEIRDDTVQMTTVLSASATWRMRNGIRRDLTAQQISQSRLFWQRDYYTLFRRFAVDDPDLWLQSGSSRRVVVHSDRLGELGWFEIATDGSPVRWGTVEGGEPLEYVYGPLRDFGGVRFPAWGANLDGSWRFEYARVTLSPSPIPARLLAPPG